ncbi:hypothetical protein QUA54_34090 [Microcoleus sp. MOSTC5]|uniref:hypothetical protein n=1 Tax=Microcoleus sp. MOSTC5 TaxID=3055378 RepID=UPI002FCFBCA0
MSGCISCVGAGLADNCFIKQTTFRQNPPLPSVTDANGHDIIGRSHKKQPHKKAKQRVHINLYSTCNVSTATRTFGVPHTAAMLYPTYE